MSVSAVVGDLASSRLYDLVTACGDGTKYTGLLTINGYTAGDCNPKESFIILKGAKVDSQNITSSIGPNKTVSVELSAQIGINSGLHFRNQAVS